MSSTRWRTSTIFDVPGTYNVAASGAMPLFKLTGLAGKLSVPVLHPFAYLGESILGPQLTPIDFDYLRYACVGDLKRMREELEFEPTYTAEATVREFAAVRKARAAVPEEIEEERLRTVIERRKRIREQMAAGGPTRHQPRGHTETEAVAVSADSNLYEEPNHD